MGRGFVCTTTGAVSSAKNAAKSIISKISKSFEHSKFFILLDTEYNAFYAYITLSTCGIVLERNMHNAQVVVVVWVNFFTLPLMVLHTGTKHFFIYMYMSRSLGVTVSDVHVVTVYWQVKYWKISKLGIINV